MLGVYIVAWKPFTKLNLEGLMDNRTCNSDIADCNCLENQQYDPEPLSNFTIEDRYQIQKALQVINNSYSQKYHQSGLNSTAFPGTTSHTKSKIAEQYKDVSKEGGSVRDFPFSNGDPSTLEMRSEL